jgi:hypothetical protein
MAIHRLIYRYELLMLKKWLEIMEEKFFKLRGGVLIIGSLLWQDHVVIAARDEKRKKWRAEYLLADRKIMVNTPIRYGRMSKGSPGQYTMVFSNGCARSKQGTGYFVPFSNQVIRSWDDLEKEAKALSGAEGMDGNFVSVERGTANVWCVLGLLLNPEHLPKNKADSLVSKWASWIKASGRKVYPAFFRQGREKPCVTAKGLLIAIPKPVLHPVTNAVLPNSSKDFNAFIIQIFIV